MKKGLLCVLISIFIVLITTTPVFAAKNKVAAWFIPDDFATIQEAIDSPDVVDGDIIRVKPGNHAGAFVTKSVTIKGMDGAVIDDGPVHPSGLVMGFRLLDGSDGSTISHLAFEVDLAIMNGGAVNSVTVQHCSFTDTIQAISNWCGSGWQIDHNNIFDLRTRNGGGIGILVADYAGGTVQDNVISHNTVSGVLHVAENDGGGYNGSGIVLYADFRWGYAGAEAIKNNKIAHNKVNMTSDTPNVVDIAAFEMTDTRDDIYAEPYPVIFDNAVGYNDFRGTELQIALTPDDLENHNVISRNFGDNRGHGLHPSLFK